MPQSVGASSEPVRPVDLRLNERHPLALSLPVTLLSNPLYARQPRLTRLVEQQQKNLRKLASRFAQGDVSALSPSAESASADPVLAAGNP